MTASVLIGAIARSSLISALSAASVRPLNFFSKSSQFFGSVKLFLLMASVSGFLRDIFEIKSDHNNTLAYDLCNTFISLLHITSGGGGGVCLLLISPKNSKYTVLNSGS